ncbi:hypothetical protein CLOBOL_01425 [Enterocloster bolteae ATCC BAA-613]|uniref:Uncharacterized protein n=1 Tax=Enterocloster bolteae (strain ATCC BAA-613 / DSM 15670 / CCUG 46953 / JCM 12243 / WAL 16351) TaxID=411902 RepID=A8RKW2_ENTBW|nr:hypothetical protein CLOBOL_01425 [Enterocloster bolteae ATCC BAA-613]
MPLRKSSIIYKIITWSWSYGPALFFGFDGQNAIFKQ